MKTLLAILLCLLLQSRSLSGLRASTAKTRPPPPPPPPPQYPYRHFNKDGHYNPEHNFRKTNLLFIMYDDLRPELSIYGKKHMKTPNFDRLAARSVTFDRAYTQVAVCNPSRVSMMTGLRPDYTSNYAFQAGYKPFLVWITQLARSGFKTSGFGKLRHHEGPDREVWNHLMYDGTPDWYTYQAYEWSIMNSSIMPDKNKPEEEFPDYIFASKTISALESLAKENKSYYMVGLGFKMPHLCLHLPYRLFDMYRNISLVDKVWKNLPNPDYLKFPDTMPLMGYRCCAETNYRYMDEEGAKLSSFYSSELGYPGSKFPLRVYNELMWAYSSMITFTDEQLGRVLDTIDRLQLWNNLTIILTSDHGMHNGEKGLWVRFHFFLIYIWNHYSNHSILLFTFSLIGKMDSLRRKLMGAAVDISSSIPLWWTAIRKTS